MSYHLRDTNDEARHWLRTEINDSNIFEQINLNELVSQILYYLQISQQVEQPRYMNTW